MRLPRSLTYLMANDAFLATFAPVRCVVSSHKKYVPGHQKNGLRSRDAITFAQK